MACVNSDGTLTPSAETVLQKARTPLTDVELAQATGLALFRIRSSLRELVEAGLLQKSEDHYIVTEIGVSKLKN